MTLLPDTTLGVWVTGRAGLGYTCSGQDLRSIRVGDPIDVGVEQDVGIRTGTLGGRHVAFLALLILDREGELRSNAGGRAPRDQRVTVAGYLGLSEHGFRRWVARTIVPQPRSIIQFMPEVMHGPSHSRTGGPWRLAVRSAHLYPDARHAWKFIEEARQKAVVRGTDPPSLLADAEAQAAMDNWTEAEEILETAREMFRRRRWSRNDPVWFAILLKRAHTAMQLGTSGGTPQYSLDILRSLTKQRLDTDEAAIVAGRAHHIAALVWGQRTEAFATERTLAALQSAEDALRGIKVQTAVDELWRIRGYREVTLAKARAEARPPSQSRVLQAAAALPNDKEEGWLRYGQTLLCADKPGRAVEYIRPALDSGKLSTPAWVIAERLDAATEWKLGASP